MTSDPGRRSGITRPAPLTSTHDLTRFDCGTPPLNDWLRNHAHRSEGRFARSYVICEKQVVVGYFCTSMGSVERAAAPGKVRRNAPEPIPVSIIGRLAVDRNHARRGLGGDLLMDAFRRIVAASEIIGVSAIIVHAKDDDAMKFYRSQAEFIEYPADSRKLYLPIETVIDALS